MGTIRERMSQRFDDSWVRSANKARTRFRVSGMTQGRQPLAAFFFAKEQ
ncbi:hypothetical protein M3223_11240 [Paenibacillus pasadenensis]|nr:hypothetical protein [Paenibacillus pasadenensis]